MNPSTTDRIRRHLNRAPFWQISSLAQQPLQQLPTG